MNKLIRYFTKNPKNLLLIDSIGALLTAFSLFVIMRAWNDYFGMPEKIPVYLAAIALCYSMYSASCFLWVKGGFPVFIRFIGIANILYCVLTAGLVITYSAQLTNLGKAYLLIEILLIRVLSYVELRVAREISK